MKKTRFSEEQIIAVLREQESGMKTADVCRRHALKLFPAEAVSSAVLKAQRAVLPKHVPVLMVGGITPDNMRDYLAAGANGSGLVRVSTAPAGAPAMSPNARART